MITSLCFFLAQTAAPAAPGNGPSFFIPFICIGVIFYFLLIRPQNKRQKELATLVSTLKTGDKVVTASGIHGMVANVKEGTTLILKIADNVKIEIDKSAIASIDKGSAPTSATPVEGALATSAKTSR